MGIPGYEIFFDDIPAASTKEGVSCSCFLIDGRIKMTSETSDEVAIMMINEMSEKDCHAVLARSSIGRLGCSLDDQPYVVPIYYAYEPDYVYILSTFGQKIEWMRTNPKVCIQVDEITNQSQWVSVIANGIYEELPEPQYSAERDHARDLLQRRHRWWLNALAERQMKSSDVLIEPLFFRIHTHSMTGLRTTAEGEAAA